MYEGREVFAQPPLALVTAEIRLSYEPRLNDTATRDTVAQAVREHLPILDSEQVVSLSVQSASGQVAEETLPQLRALNPEKTATLTLNANALTVQVVEYEHFGSFLELVTVCLQALAPSVPGALVRRVGLRYINEVRIPGGVTDTREWSKWLSSDLLAAFALLPDQPVGGLNGSVLFHVDRERNILFRWGEAVGRSILVPTIPLRRPELTEGRFFLLDTDSFWEPGSPQSLDVPRLADELGRLHVPIGKLFLASLTEDVKALFRGRDSDA
jgi:uncharacterized protein (TIGR04255 family)